MTENDDQKAKQFPRKKLLEASLELKKALNSWEELSNEAKGLSKDDQMLQEIKGLLGRLKSQIDQFS